MKKKSQTLNQADFTRAKATILSRRELIRKSPSPSTGRLLQTSTDAHEPKRRRLILSIRSCNRKPSPCRHSISIPATSRHHRISCADCPCRDNIAPRRHACLPVPVLRCRRLRHAGSMVDASGSSKNEHEEKDRDSHHLRYSFHSVMRTFFPSDTVRLTRETFPDSSNLTSISSAK